MSISALLAILGCAACIAAKISLTVRVQGLARIQAQEEEVYQKAQNELFQTQQKYKQLESEIKHIEARMGATERNIKDVEGTLNKLQRRKEEEEAVRAYQEALIKGEKPK